MGKGRGGGGGGGRLGNIVADIADKSRTVESNTFFQQKKTGGTKYTYHTIIMNT